MTDETNPTVDIQLWSEIHTKAEAEKSDADGFMDELKQMNVNSQEDLEFAAQILAETKGKIKQLEKMRGQATKPLTQSTEVIRSWFRPTITMLKEAERILKQKIAEAHQRAEVKQQAALEAAGQAAISGDEAGAAAAMQQATQAELTGVGGIQFRETWGYEVTDIGQVPPEYLLVIVNEAVVNETIKTHKGETNIPGIRVFKKTGVASRSA